jgi:hypothetical protein
MQLRQKVPGHDRSHPVASTEQPNGVEINPGTHKTIGKLENSICNDVVHLKL